MKVFREIHTMDDHYILQADINALIQWSIKNKMKFHPNKCKVLRCTLKKRNISLFTYEMSNTVLQLSNCEKDLGVIVTTDLKWNKHHSTLLSKASQKLGLLRRSCSFSKNLAHRRTLYLAIVRAQFEHCSQIWRPINLTSTGKFEALQKRGIKWIFNEDFCCYSKKEYFNKLKLLNILPLSLNFDMNDFTLFHSTFYGSSTSLKFPAYLFRNNRNDATQDSQRHTRSITASDNLQLKCSTVPKINAFSDSFFYRTHLKWNGLPKELREIKNPSSFKLSLKEHIWLLAEQLYCGD